MKKRLWKYLVPRCLKAVYYANKRIDEVAKKAKDQNWLNKKTELFTEEEKDLTICQYFKRHQKPKGMNEYIPEELNPAELEIFPMQEYVFVKEGDRSPADVLAARIAARILREKLCTVTKSKHGELEKYVIEVIVAKKKTGE